MGFKTVFFAMSASQDDTELDRATAIAHALDAHLSVLVIGLAPPPPASPYGVVSNDVWAGEIREGQDSVQKRADAIAARLSAADQPAGVEAQYVDRGTVATLAARFARYADLALVPIEAEGFETIQSWVMNGALFESGCPLLLLPTGQTAFPTVRRVMIAWDASVEAAKSVRDAIGIMQTAEEVEIVLIDPVPTYEGHGPEPGADLAAYLARHGLHPNVHRLPREGMEIGEVLSRAARDLDCDLIVMGGFGHSRLRQRFFGGTTATMMKSAPVPVLMAH